MLAAVYARLSDDRTGMGVQIARQLVDCRQIAHVRFPDYDVAEYVDNDRSAYSRTPRPEYDRMLADIKARRVTAVVAWNLDRLLRQPRQLEELIDLGAPIVTAQGDLDLTTHDGQLHARILAAVAKKSSDDTSRRVRRAAKDRAEAGSFHGGRHVPFGLRKSAAGGYELAADEVQAIRDVAAAVLDGHALQQLVNARPHPRAPTSREAWRQILTGPVARGMNSAGVAAGWGPMLDSSTAAQLHVALAKKGRRPSVRWPLSSVLRCGVCQGSMHGAQSSRPHYICQRAHVSINAPDLETYVEAALDLSVIVVHPEPARVDDQGLRDATLEHLAQEYARGLITRREWEAARSAVVLQDRPTRDQVIAVRRTADVGNDRGQHTANDGHQFLVNDAGLDDISAVQDGLAGWRRLAAIDHILIDKARARGIRFDDGRVHIRWRR